MIKILFLAANPSDTEPLQLAEEVRAIDEALQRGRYRDAFDLESHWAVRTSDVQGLLLRHEPDIVHFSGHGSTEGAIVLEDERGETREVPPQYLRTLFRAMAGRTRCVVLNACYSENQATDIVEEAGILIGMTDAIGDRAARTFSASFYQAIAYGQDVQTAFDLGREQISMDMSPDADVLRLLHAQNVLPRAVRFAQPQGTPSLPPPENPAAPPWWKRWEIVIPALTAIVVALIGIIPPLLDRIWPVLTPDAAIVVAAPTDAPTTPISAAFPTPLMPTTGFNIAVAAFVEETATGQFTVTGTSTAISEWLYAAIGSEASRLPATLRHAALGPQEIPPVVGLTGEERSRSGQGFADRNNITLLIYGVVSRVGDEYVVTPEFYVGEDSFSYGSEIVGSNRLGQPVPFQLPITSATLATVNRELDSRTQALRHIIQGLAFYSIDDSVRAIQAFDDALATPGWEAGEGQEVVYTLIGAAALAAYDQFTNREPLPDANAAFARAYALKPQYARALLGMGAVILQEACILNDTHTQCEAFDKGKLEEARQWYVASLGTTDQQPSYFVELKAAYGLGQIEMVGGEYGMDGFALPQARRYFEQVIALGEGYSSRTLVWYVGNAYAYLGRIAGLNKDFAGMAEMYHQSNRILDNLRPNEPAKTIARNWAHIGFAEKQQGKPAEARNAYCQAVRLGEGFVGGEEMIQWSTECETGG